MVDDSDDTPQERQPGGAPRRSFASAARRAARRARRRAGEGGRARAAPDRRLAAARDRTPPRRARVPHHDRGDRRARALARDSRGGRGDDPDLGRARGGTPSGVPAAASRRRRVLPARPAAARGRGRGLVVAGAEARRVSLHARAARARDRHRLRAAAPVRAARGAATPADRVDAVRRALPPGARAGATARACSTRSCSSRA